MTDQDPDGVALPCPKDGCDCRTNQDTEIQILRQLRTLVVHHTGLVEGGMDAIQADVEMMQVCSAHGWFQRNMGVMLATFFGIRDDDEET